MVGYAALYGERTIYLLKQHHARDLVVEDHLAERQNASCLASCCASCVSVRAIVPVKKVNSSEFVLFVPIKQVTFCTSKASKLYLLHALAQSAHWRHLWRRSRSGRRCRHSAGCSL